MHIMHVHVLHDSHSEVRESVTSDLPQAKLVKPCHSTALEPKWHVRVQNICPPGLIHPALSAENAAQIDDKIQPENVYFSRYIGLEELLEDTILHDHRRRLYRQRFQSRERRV